MRDGLQVNLRLAAPGDAVKQEDRGRRTEDGGRRACNMQSATSNFAGGISIEDGLRELFAMSDTSRLALGANGRALVAEKFAWPKIAAEMKSVYTWVLGGGTRPACLADF